MQLERQQAAVGGERVRVTGRRWTVLAVVSVVGVRLALPWVAEAGIASGVYQTVSGMSVEERGDRVPGGVRMVPLSAVVTLDLGANPPRLEAVISDAVLEGGAPFPLTVHSLSGTVLTDGSCQFTGDYLRDLFPAGTQYLFDWRFGMATNGSLVWNGFMGWTGGHLWLVTLTNVLLEPLPYLSVARAGAASVQITWATNFAEYVLEFSTQLSGGGWSAITNGVDRVGERLGVTEPMSVRGFYRLRRL